MGVKRKAAGIPPSVYSGPQVFSDIPTCGCTGQSTNSHMETVGLVTRALRYFEIKRETRVPSDGIPCKLIR